MSTTADPFDPYHVWLGIPPERQPPHHYDILGIQLFEEVVDVIQSAVDQRMTYLRTFQTGKHNHFAEKLLNEVATAKVCLLNPEKKAAYDEALRARLAADSYAAVSLDTTRGKLPSAIKRWAPLAAAVVGGVALLVAGLLVWGPGDGPAHPDGTVAEGESTTETPEPGQKLPPADDPAKAKPDDSRPNAVEPPSPGELSPKDEAAPKDEVPSKEPLAEPPEKPPPPVVKPEPKPEPPPPVIRLVDEPPPAVKVVDEPPLPVPSEQVQQEITGKLDEIYDLAEAKTSQRRLELAGLLASLARQARDNPAEHYVLLDKAMELATAGGDAALAVEAAETAAARFDVDPLGLKHKVILEVAAGMIGGEQIASFVETSLATVDESLAGEQFDAALEIVEAALRVCQRSAGREHRKRVFDRRTEVKELHDSWQESQQALAILKESPSDSRANLVAGRWYCFSRGDWKQGIPMLALGSDAALKAVAAKELEEAASPEAQSAVGDAWWDLAETKTGREKDSLMLRAGHWYEQARPKATGLAKARLVKRLEDIAKIEPPAQVGTTGARRKGRPSARLTGGPFDPATAVLLATLQGHTGAVRSVAFSADGKTLVSASEDKTVRFWDPARGQLRGMLPPFQHEQLRVAVSPKGSLLAVANGDRNVSLWDAARGQLRGMLSAHKGHVWGVAFSGDGSLLASGGDDKAIIVWDVASGNLRQTLLGSGSRVFSVAMNADGSRVAAGHVKRVATLWDVAAEAGPKVLSGHRWDVRCVAFSPDGSILASGSKDTAVKLWAAEEHANRDLRTEAIRNQFRRDGGKCDCLQLG
jgi:hypothetical protein